MSCDICERVKEIISTRIINFYFVDDIRDALTRLTTDCETTAVDALFTVDEFGRYIPNNLIPNDLDSADFSYNRQGEFLISKAKNVAECSGDIISDNFNMYDLLAEVIDSGKSKISIGCALELNNILREEYVRIKKKLNSRNLDCNAIDAEFLKAATAPLFEGVCYIYRDTDDKNGYILKKELAVIKKATDAYFLSQTCSSINFADFREESLLDNEEALNRLREKRLQESLTNTGPP